MDQPYHMAQSLGDYLHPDRSSTVALIESLPELLSHSDRTVDSASPGNTPSSTSLPSLATNFSSESEDSPYQACTVTSSYTPQILSAQPLIDHTWNYLAAAKSSETPVVRLGEARDDTLASLKPTHQPSQRVAIFNPDDMSTLGIKFEPQFDAITRPSYTWPAFDLNEPYGSHEIGPLDPYNMSSMVPTYTKSLSSSPPQVLFTPEQRELKRQRDLARRETKKKLRRDRSLSDKSYQASHSTSPNLIARSVDSYSSSLAPSSVSIESSPTFTNTAYMPSLVPGLPTSESPELFGAPFPLMSNDFGVNVFMMPYTSAADQTVSSFPTRPHSLSSASDQPCFYRSSPAAAQDSQETVRVVHSRPKPQCWDHGCNGRQFSTFSNLLRHQREKSGVSSKPSCPKCGAEFTRTTARNGHMAHEKCKQRRNSNL